MTKPTLLILAAGLSTRYRNGLKQTASVGPQGETLMDYSIQSANRAGFGKVVCVIQSAGTEKFAELLVKRYGAVIDLDFVPQQINDIPKPNGIELKRAKPWGTGHAVWAARHKINSPFAVINADDYYGSQAFRLMYKFLSARDLHSSEYAMVGYYLKNTLSQHGGVSRGICQVMEQNLVNISECHDIRDTGQGIVGRASDGSQISFSPRAITSMNFWGLQPTLFDSFEKYFLEFLQRSGNPEADEFYLPVWIQKLLQISEIRVKVYQSPEKWLGLTYPEDREDVVKKLANMQKG